MLPRSPARSNPAPLEFRSGDFAQEKKFLGDISEAAAGGSERARALARRFARLERDVAELPRETAMHAAARAQIKTRLRALEVEYNAKAMARLRSVPEALEERLDRELAEIERRIAKFPR